MFHVGSTGRAFKRSKETIAVHKFLDLYVIDGIEKKTTIIAIPIICNCIVVVGTYNNTIDRSAIA